MDPETRKSMKPLGVKAYGHIPHLPGSRLGPGDHTCHEGQARICTEKTRDRHDRIIVTEKLDGSCVAVANIDGVIVPLNRAGYRAAGAPHLQHRLFHVWVMENQQRFLDAVEPGHRLAGEWLALAHGTRYDLDGREPWVAFDYIGPDGRLPHDVARAAAVRGALAVPHVLFDGPPVSIEDVREAIQVSHYGALDPVEGAVWRVERRGQFDYVAKWVRPDKVDGSYLPEISGKEAVWNWWPSGLRPQDLEGNPPA